MSKQKGTAWRGRNCPTCGHQLRKRHRYGGHEANCPERKTEAADEALRALQRPRGEA